MRRTTLRMFRAHAEAYFRDRFLWLSALGTMTGGGDAADRENAPESEAQEPTRDASAAAPRRRRVVRLPSWYELPANVENPRILGMEDDLGRLQAVASASRDEREDRRQIEREYRVR